MNTFDETPKPGDYCLGTKYCDGDPGDPWGLGIYAYERDGRHYLKNFEGEIIYAGGYQKVAPVQVEIGTWLLKVANALESSPPGSVNLWTMLNPWVFERETDEAHR